MATNTEDDIAAQFYGCMTGVALGGDAVEICSGVTLEPVFVDTFGPTLAAFSPPGPPFNSHPGPWVIVDYGAMHRCRVQIAVVPPQLAFPLSGKEAAWLATSVLRLQVPFPIRLAIGSTLPFTEMRENAATAKPFAYEAAPHQLGVFQMVEDEHRLLSDRDLDWLKAFVPVAGELMKDERFFRAFSIYDQAQWARTIEAGMTLVWTALEVLFSIGTYQHKTKAICRALSEYVTSDRSERDRAYNITQKLCEQRGRIVHAGHALSEQDAIQAFQLAQVVFRRVLIDQSLPSPFTP